MLTSETGAVLTAADYLAPLSHRPATPAKAWVLTSVTLSAASTEFDAPARLTQRSLTAEPHLDAASDSQNDNALHRTTSCQMPSVVSERGNPVSRISHYAYCLAGI